MALGISLLLSLVKDLNVIALTLLEKDLNAVVRESEAEQKKRFRHSRIK